MPRTNEIKSTPAGSFVVIGRDGAGRGGEGAVILVGLSLGYV